MSRPVHERLRELTEDVRDLRFRPAAEVRERGRRRGRRQAAALVTAGAVVVTGVGVGVAWPSPAPQPVPVAAPPALNCVLALPDGPEQVRLRVLNGGAPSVKLASAAAELRERRFTVLDGAPGDSPSEAVTVRYGPAAIGAAALVRAVLRDEAIMRFEPERGDDTIDVVLGTSFTRLATSTEINQKLVTLGKPAAPPGC